MKKETKEFVRLIGIAVLVMLVVPIAYRVCVYFWPPDTQPRPTLDQFVEEAKSERCLKLLAKPIAKWTETDVKSEPEIYAWLKGQGNEILPWDWTDEARRKDPKGYVKCWQRIWKARKSHCAKLFAKHQEELERLDRELQILATIHAHRTNQIARLRALAATNTFPCQVALERLEKGRFWGWNRKVETVACEDVAAIVAATNSVCSKESATAADERRRLLALERAVSSAKERLALYGNLIGICDRSNNLIENDSSQDELLKKALIENLKGAER
jgi:hypothetical protein